IFPGRDSFQKFWNELCGAWPPGPSGSAVRELAWLFVGGRGGPCAGPKSTPIPPRPYHRCRRSEASTSYLGCDPAALSDRSDNLSPIKWPVRELVPGQVGVPSLSNPPRASNPPRVSKPLRVSKPPRGAERTSALGVRAQIADGVRGRRADASESKRRAVCAAPCLSPHVKCLAGVLAFCVAEHGHAARRRLSERYTSPTKGREGSCVAEHGHAARRRLSERYTSAQSASSRRKYATVGTSPASSDTFGSHPSSVRARMMSGRRCLGSFSGSGLTDRTRPPFPTTFRTASANSIKVISRGFPRLTGRASPFSCSASSPETRSST